VLPEAVVLFLGPLMCSVRTLVWPDGLGLTERATMLAWPVMLTCVGRLAWQKRGSSRTIKSVQLWPRGVWAWTACAAT